MSLKKKKKSDCNNCHVILKWLTTTELSALRQKLWLIRRERRTHVTTGDVSGVNCLLIRGTRLAQCLGCVGTCVVKCLLHRSSPMLQTCLMVVYIICGLFFFTCTKIKQNPHFPLLVLLFSICLSCSFSPVKRKNTMFILIKKGASWILQAVICGLVVGLLLDEECDSWHWFLRQP